MSEELLRQARESAVHETAKDRLINRLADRIEELEAEAKRLRKALATHAIRKAWL